MSEDLAWLLEQIADDEAAAQRCPGTDFSIAEYPSRPGLFEVEAYAPGSLDRFDDVVPRGGMAEPYAQHVERWDPKRVLAECDSKRRLVRIHDPLPPLGEPAGWKEGMVCCRCCGYGGEYPVAWPCDTIRLVAAPFVNRPGCPEAWQS